MKRILTMIALAVSLNGFSQSDFDISKDEKNGSVVYKGEITFTDLQKESSFDWLQKNQSYLKPDANTVTFLQEHLSDYDMVVFMGTWCEDSHILIPQLYKLLSDINYPMEQLTMYGVDRSKTTKGDEHTQYGIDRVPTIILLRDNTEAGRITEVVKKSIDKDIADIIKAGE